MNSTRRPIVARLILIGMTVVGLALGSACGIEPDRAVEKKLAGGETHSSQIDLSIGQSLEVHVVQKGIDVVTGLFAPDGRKLAHCDSPSSTWGLEVCRTVAATAGSYEIRVRALYRGSRSGRYQIWIAPPRESTSRDRQLSRAKELEVKVSRLQSEKTTRSLQRAVAFSEEVVSLRRNAGDRGAEADALSEMADIYRDLGRPMTAIHRYREASELWRAEDRMGQVSKAQAAIGDVYAVTLGETHMARDLYESALRSSEEAVNPRWKAGALTGLGDCHTAWGDKGKAGDYYRQALAIFRDIDVFLGQALVLRKIGRIHETSDQPRQALVCYRRALDLWQVIEHRKGIDILYRDISRIYASLGHKEQALEYCSRSLAKARGDPIREAWGHGTLAGLYRSLGEEDKAWMHYREARRLTQGSGSISEAVTLYGLARIGRDFDHLKRARTDIENALEIIEARRTKIGSLESPAPFLASRYDHYELYVDLLMRLHAREPETGYDVTAFEASERARAQSLLEVLGETRAQIRRGVDPELLEGESSLQNQLDSWEERRLRYGHRRSSAEAVSEGQERSDLLARLQETRTEIRRRSPRYAALTRPRPLSLEEIRQVLDPETLLLEYRLGTEKSYVWAVTSSSLASFELPARAEIEDAAERVYDLLTAREWKRDFETAGKRERRIAAADARYPQATAELNRLVLGPVASRLSARRLVIVSEGALRYIPFAALPDPAGSHGEPLLVNHEIVHLPSASVLPVLRDERHDRPAAEKALAVLADPVFKPSDARVAQPRLSGSTATYDNAGDLTRVLRDLGFADLDRLPATRDEAEAIAALAPRASLKALDFDASRETVMTGDLDRYRIVHFATHGFVDDKHPELSGLVLSLVDERGEPQNGFLRLHEIYNLDLAADLVVLSACRTALGKQIRGEGLVGLTRGFMYAGAAAVVASLWSPQDRATAELMRRFYRGMMVEGQPPPAALRAAQLSLWREERWSQPFYWAAFIFQGDWRSFPSAELWPRPGLGPAAARPRPRSPDRSLARARFQLD